VCHVICRRVYRQPAELRSIQHLAVVRNHHADRVCWEVARLLPSGGGRDRWWRLLWGGYKSQ